MIEFFTSNLPWFWLSLMVFFVVVEAFTMTLTTVWAALASVPMIFIAKTALPFRWQILIFLILTIALAVLTRPFAVKKLKLGKEKLNVNSMLNQEVLVIRPVTKFQKGTVKSKNGVLWTATAYEDSKIEQGTVCTVTDVQGNTLKIKAKMEEN